MGPLLIAAAASQAIGSLFGAIQGAKMLKEAKKINPVYKAYEDSPYAKAQLGMAQMGLNAKNPATAIAEKQMLAGQANALAAGQRAGLDPAAQAAMALASQGQIESGAQDLAKQNALFFQQNKQDLFNAQNVMTGEHKMKYQDMLNKYQMDLSQKNALRSAGQQNITSAFSNLSSSLIGTEKLRQAGK